MAKKRANGEGNIRKRADGRWEGRYTAGYHPETGKRIIKNVLGKTQAECKAKLSAAMEATIQPLIYRLVCSNGMVINDAKTRRNHVGRAATSEEDFSIYSNETLLADDHAFVLKIKDTVRAAISEARFAQVVSRMRESTEAMLDTKQLPAIVKLASSSFGITEDESNGVLEHLITGGDFSLYGLANAVTRFSQDVESYDRATKLEEIGYSVMTMSPALFRQMNRTELLAA